MSCWETRRSALSRLAMPFPLVGSSISMAVLRDLAPFVTNRASWVAGLSSFDRREGYAPKAHQLLAVDLRCDYLDRALAGVELDHAEALRLFLAGLHRAAQRLAVDLHGVHAIGRGWLGVVRDCHVVLRRAGGAKVPRDCRIRVGPLLGVRVLLLPLAEL